MFDFTCKEELLVPRKGLYCIWIRAHEGDNAPLIRVWIDPSMTIFEPRAKVNEPDATAVREEYQEPLAKENPSQVETGK